MNFSHVPNNRLCTTSVQKTSPVESLRWHLWAADPGRQSSDPTAPAAGPGWRLERAMVRWAWRHMPKAARAMTQDDDADLYRRAARAVIAAMMTREPGRVFPRLAVAPVAVGLVMDGGPGVTPAAEVVVCGWCHVPGMYKTWGVWAESLRREIDGPGAGWGCWRRWCGREATAFGVR
jgi:hypothetical protein